MNKENENKIRNIMICPRSGRSFYHLDAAFKQTLHPALTFSEKTYYPRFG